MNRTTLVAVAVVAWIAGFGVARAETGMGLMVDSKAGDLRRVDLKDGKVVATSAGIGSNIVMGRFSPDGSKMVTIDKSKNVAIRDLDGNVIRSFTASEATTTDWGNAVSWTNSGIWVGGTGDAARYDATTGAHQETVTLKAGGSGATATTAAEAAQTRVRTVSHNDRTAGGRPEWAAAVLLAERDNDNRAPVVKLGSGCSVSPSPDGSKLTRNLWETGLEHQTMTIHDRAGAELHKFYLYDKIPWPRKNDPNDPNRVTEQHATLGFTWNSQSWSSNSSDIILIPSGRCFKQMYEDNPECSTMPWIYNLSSQEAFCLYDANNDGTADCMTKGVWWYIKDFFQGKISTDFECGGPQDCHGGTVCTDKVCSGGKCSYPAKPHCCLGPQDCDAGGACTNVECVDNACQYPAIPGCCKADGDCEDGNVCTTNSCNKDTGDCSEQTDPLCCQDDGACEDGNPCTTNTCNRDTGECSEQTDPLCCLSPAECNDEDECTEDLCNASNQCEHPAIDGCVVLPSVDLESPQGGEIWASGSTANIKWSAKVIKEVVLYLSKDAGETWDPIGKVHQSDDNWGDYQYAVPTDVESDACMVMVEDYFQQGSVKSEVFSISVDSSSKKGLPDAGVLLGSCDIGPDDHRGSPFPWLLGLVLAALVWAGRRRWAKG